MVSCDASSVFSEIAPLGMLISVLSLTGLCDQTAALLRKNFAWSVRFLYLSDVKGYAAGP
jgi:hypothetical protein